MADAEFVQELFELCRKYRKNLHGTFEGFSPDLSSQEYEVYVNGAWDIRDTENAVEVYKVKPQDCEFTIKGTVSSSREDALNELTAESQRLGLYD